MRAKLPEIGQVVAGHRIEGVAGEGAAGMVYEAIDRLDRTVALKLLKPEVAEDEQKVREFQNEAEATGSVDHENVVTVFGCGFEDGFHYLRMEFVDGPPLHEHLRAKGRLPWKEAVRIGIQVARALEHAHGRGLIHRDVKPENILLYEDGRARLTDFGIVKDISSLKGYLVKGRTVGTAAYASPEQCLQKRLDAATDIYSLGATLYTLLCGRYPFLGKSRSEIMKKHVQMKPIAPCDLAPDVPKSLSNLIEKMLAKKQTDRPDSMTQVIGDLELILEGKVAIPDAKKRVDPSALHGLTPGRRTRSTGPGRAARQATTSALYITLGLVALAAAAALLIFAL